jgi:hypothetical protein
MSFSDSRRTTGIYDDPHLQALALEAATSERPASALEWFGLAPTVPQQPAISPVLLQLLAQMARDKVETDPLVDPRGNIPGTNIPDRGVPEAAREKFPKRDFDVDLGIERFGKPDPNLDRGMELPSIHQGRGSAPTRPMRLPLFLMRR